MTSARAPKRRNPIGEAFASRPISMLRSPAWNVTSLSARKVLDRIEIELAQHAGRDNGRLPCTFDQFAEFGMDRHAIAPAIRELVGLGIIEVTEHGRSGNAGGRRPNLFRLTYRHTESGEPTHEWRRIKSVEAAEAIARSSRSARGAPREDKLSSGDFAPCRSGENPHYKPKSPVGKTPTTAKGEKPPLPIESRDVVPPHTTASDDGACLSLGEAARLKCCHPKTIKAAIETGRLPARRCDVGYSINVVDLEQFRPARVLAAKSAAERVCLACGNPFEARRPAAKFCSPTCTKNWPRRKRRAEARAARGWRPLQGPRGELAR